jgi:hypothetical protein
MWIETRTSAGAGLNSRSTSRQVPQRASHLEGLEDVHFVTGTINAPRQARPLQSLSDTPA